MLHNSTNSTPFDYASLDEPEELIAPKMTDAEREKVTTALSEFAHWMVDSQGRCPHTLDVALIGRRVVAAMWVMRPDIILNRTLPQLARECGVSAVAISKMATRFSARTGIKGRAQHSAATRARKSFAKLQAACPADPSRN